LNRQGSNVNDLPNAKISVQLEQLESHTPLDESDVETAAIYWGAFKKDIETRINASKKSLSYDNITAEASE